MPSEPAIRVRGVSKVFRVYSGLGSRLSDLATFGRSGRKLRHWAVRDVSFDVEAGESLALLGVNGSGKSTLLQMICGTTVPTEGEISYSGRIAALLELGSGFNPEFTGRENARIALTLGGCPEHEIEDRLAEAIAFADIARFIDQPTRTYSSGMFVRIAFAAAVMSDPDILVVDEALAVGDGRFRAKCYRHIESLRRRGTSLLFVSHDLETVRSMTDRALFLHKGRKLMLGPTAEVAKAYQQFELQSREPAASEPEATPEAADPAVARVDSVVVRGPSRIVSGQPVEIDLSCTALVDCDHLNVGVRIRGDRGVKVYSWGTLNQDMKQLARDPARTDTFWHRKFTRGESFQVRLRSDSVPLGAGPYVVEAILSRETVPDYSGQQVLHWIHEAATFDVETDWSVNAFGGICDLRMSASWEASENTPRRQERVA